MLLLHLNVAGFGPSRHHPSRPRPFTLQAGPASHCHATDPRLPLLSDLACSTKQGEPGFLLYRHSHVTVCTPAGEDQTADVAPQTSNLPCRARLPGLVLKLTISARPRAASGTS